MNKKELIAKLAEKLGTTKKAAGENLDAVLEVITEALIEGNDIRLTGFGTFEVVERAARVGVNPQNPEVKIEIPASKAVKFKVASALKAAVKGE